jgi:hypothetical protein
VIPEAESPRVVLLASEHLELGSLGVQPLDSLEGVRRVEADTPAELPERIQEPAGDIPEGERHSLVPQVPGQASVEQQEQAPLREWQEGEAVEWDHIRVPSIQGVETDSSFLVPWCSPMSEVTKVLP